MLKLKEKYVNSKSFSFGGLEIKEVMKLITENEMKDQFCFIPLKLFNHAKISQLPIFYWNLKS